MVDESHVEDDEEPFAKNTLITDVFGDHPKSRILSALLSELRWTDIGHLCHLTGLDSDVLVDNIEDFKKLNLVKQDRKNGKRYYQINKSSTVAQHIGQLEWDLMDVSAREK